MITNQHGTLNAVWLAGSLSNLKDSLPINEQNDQSKATSWQSRSTPLSALIQRQLQRQKRLLSAISYFITSSGHLSEYWLAQWTRLGE
jgi:hypothetical protein